MSKEKIWCLRGIGKVWVRAEIIYLYLKGYKAKS